MVFKTIRFMDVARQVLLEILFQKYVNFFIFYGNGKSFQEDRIFMDGINGFARKLVLAQRQKVTRKWPIRDVSHNSIAYANYPL